MGQYVLVPDVRWPWRPGAEKQVRFKKITKKLEDTMIIQTSSEWCVDELLCYVYYRINDSYMIRVINIQTTWLTYQVSLFLVAKKKKKKHKLY